MTTTDEMLVRITTLTWGGGDPEYPIKRAELDVRKLAEVLVELFNQNTN